MQKNDIIITVEELIEFLNTLDKSKTITGEYIHVVGSQFINIKERPLLKSLFETDENGDYKLKAMFY